MKKWQKGSTLIELILGTAIAVLVVGGVGETTATLMLNYGKASEQTVALPYVQNAGYWISRDIQTARTVTPGEGNGFPLTLAVPVDEEAGNDYTVEYCFEGDRLQRHLYDATMTLVSGTFIADHISTTDTLFTTLDAEAGFHELTVRAEKDGDGATRTYKINQRL